jgi:protein ImuB
MGSSSQRIMSLWLHRLSTDRIAPKNRRPDRPRVIAGKRGNVELVVAVDAGAEQLGLRPGLALAQARAMHPQLVAIAEDADADARALAAIADACQRYTPLVALDPPDGLLLDIAGCAHLFGGEYALADDLHTRLAGWRLHGRIAVADTIGAAWAGARYGPRVIPGRRESTSFVFPSEITDKLLALLPLTALRLDAEIVGALARVGLKHIGDILDLPRAPLAARFGAGLLLQLDRALGREREPLTPLRPVAPYLAEQRFAEPIAREEDVLAAIEKLAARLRRALEQRGDGARQIELALFRTDGEVRRLTVATSRPLRDPHDIRALFVERLAVLADSLDPGFGFDLARLSVLVAEPCPPQQTGFSDEDDGLALDRLVDRVSARLGRRRITRLVAPDSHIPELAAAALPAQSDIADPGWDAFRRHRAAADLAPRPLRLLARPEPIEVVAMVPEGPPLRFRWRRALHEVIAVEGPERIEGAWWSEGEVSGPARDYFRVEDKTGLRFWLFRAGLYRDTAAPAWFLHGTFA